MSESTNRLCPHALREQIRSGAWTGHTAGRCAGFVQANLVIVPAVHAGSFLEFCVGNPGPCPLIEVTLPGESEPRGAAPGADLRTDLPRYRVYRNGVPQPEVTDLSAIWRNDLVAFLLGCSFTFEAALQQDGIPVRHLEQGRNVPMYITKIPCRPARPFKGPLVVSMRPIPDHLVTQAVAISRRYPLAHGAPVHVGDSHAIGIADLARPDFGDSVPVNGGETPVFWACGVTPQVAAIKAHLDLLITHAPGHMFVTDLSCEENAGR
ncbi:MAG: putative hydro-lyase [Gemmatimonadota bacterium]|nr:MAG: putative hydro-lyase [Gemmatimonadota bacterium]